MATQNLQPYQVLEKRLANWSGADYVAVCSSGTAALHLALESLQLPLGSEVIVPDFTMVACARAVALAGLTPVFVDCLPNLLMDPDCLERAITPNTSAIMVVHIYGRAVDMRPVVDLANKYNLMIIEDLAEAHGLPPHPQTDAACWSFYMNKVIAGEEGGAVAFRDGEHYDRAVSLRSLGFTPDHDFYHLPRGHNYRLANALATIILRRLDLVASGTRMTFANGGGPLDGLTMIEARRRIESWYEAECPEGWRMPTRDVPWVYDLRIRWMTEKCQMRVVASLNRSGIPARHAFKPMSEQAEFSGKRVVSRTKESVASRIAREVIYLPLTPQAGYSPATAHGIFAAIKTIV